MIYALIVTAIIFFIGGFTAAVMTEIAFKDR